MNEGNVKKIGPKQIDSTPIAKTAAEIKTYIESLVSEKFTGEVRFKLRFNQGGIRDSRVTLDKSL